MDTEWAAMDGDDPPPKLPAGAEQAPSKMLCDLCGRSPEDGRGLLMRLQKLQKQIATTRQLQALGNEEMSLISCLYGPLT